MSEISGVLVACIILFVGGLVELRIAWGYRRDAEELLQRTEAVYSGQEGADAS